jgi:arylsulfatase A-like enzyme
MTRDVVPRTSPEKWHEMVRLYDAEIAFVDSQVGALVRELQRRNLYDDTIVIVTADHGELFGEHGLATHFKALDRGGAARPPHRPLPARHPEGHPRDDAGRAGRRPADGARLRGRRPSPRWTGGTSAR